MKELTSEVRSLQKIRSKGKRRMETSEEEAVSLQVRPWSEKVVSEGKYGLEEKKKEKVLQLKYKVRASLEKFVASEKESHMEKKKEASLFSKVPLLHLPLESWHHITSQDTRNQLFPAGSVGTRVAPKKHWIMERLH